MMPPPPPPPPPSSPCVEGKGALMSLTQSTISFEEVAVYFTQGEWTFLHPTQRALYKQVMLENFGNWASLGQEAAIAKPDLISWLEEEEELFLHGSDEEEGLAGGEQDIGDDEELNQIMLDKAKHEDSQENVWNQSGLKRQKESHTVWKSPGQGEDFPAEIQKKMERYKCSDCDKNFSQKTDLIQHQNIPSGEKHFLCSERYSNGKKSNVHFPSQYNNIDKSHKCFPCGKYFTYRTELLRHQKIHNRKKPFECSKCGKEFSQCSDLQSLQRTHTGEKPFECFDCGKKFSHSDHLQSHERSHTGEKPFECLDCGKKFSQSDHLQSKFCSP